MACLDKTLEQLANACHACKFIQQAPPVMPLMYTHGFGHQSPGRESMWILLAPSQAKCISWQWMLIQMAQDPCDEDSHRSQDHTSTQTHLCSVWSTRAAASLGQWSSIHF